MRIQLSLIVASTVLLTACGGLGKSATGTTDADAAAAVQQVNNQMAQVREAASKAQLSLDNAQNAMNVLTDANGHIKFSIFFGGVKVSDLGTCVKSQFSPDQLLFLPQDIANALKCVLDDVATVVSSVKDDIGMARSQLAAALANVQPNSLEATEIQALMAQIDSVETSYTTLIHSLAGQVTMAVTYLNTLPTLATGVCPMPFPGLNLICGGLVTIFIQPLVTEITSFQIQLQSL